MMLGGSGAMEAWVSATAPGNPVLDAGDLEIRPDEFTALANGRALPLDAAQRVLVAVHGQDPTRTIGDGNDAADALDLARDRRGGATEVSKHDLVLKCVLGGRLILRRRSRCPR